MKALKIKLRADKLCKQLSGFYDGVPECSVFSEDVFRRFTDTLARRLQLDPYTVYRSCLTLLDKPRTKEACWKVCYSLAANISALSWRHVVPVDGSLMSEGVVEVRCLSVSYLSEERLVVKYQALTGSTALRVFRLALTLNAACRWLTLMGYSNREGGKFLFQSPSTAFPGMFGAVTLTQDTKVSRMPVWKVDMSPYAPALTYNRKNILMFRSGLAPCPFGKDDQIADNGDDYCSTYCEYGWHTCQASGHAVDYIRATCDYCREENRLVEPGDIKMCLACKMRESKVSEYER